MVRPSLVIADPEAMTGQQEGELRASAMNALAHGADTLYLPLSNPVSEMTALRGAELIAGALDQEREARDRAALALGSILCGYAIDSAGIGLHHLVCQTLVRVCGTPHAETNAAILPHAAGVPRRAGAGALRAARRRARHRAGSSLPERIDGARPAPAASASSAGTSRSWTRRSRRCSKRPELERVPGPPTAEDLMRLVRRPGRRDGSGPGRLRPAPAHP